MEIKTVKLELTEEEIGFLISIISGERDNLIKMINKNKNNNLNNMLEYGFTLLDSIFKKSTALLGEEDLIALKKISKKIGFILKCVNG